MSTYPIADTSGVGTRVETATEYRPVPQRKRPAHQGEQVGVADAGDDHAGEGDAVGGGHPRVAARQHGGERHPRHGRRHAGRQHHAGGGSDIIAGVLMVAGDEEAHCQGLPEARDHEDDPQP
jgi:hypothetical protein